MAGETVEGSDSASIARVAVGVAPPGAFSAAQVGAPTVARSQIAARTDGPEAHAFIRKPILSSCGRDSPNT
jgi:hypothetical protein